MTDSNTTEHGVHFTLFAPYNSDVSVMGTWNDWQENTPMQQDDKGWWHARVDLPNGDYQYKFQLRSKSFFQKDQMIDVADPRGLEVSLDEYENTCITVRDNKHVFISHEWKHDNVPLPPNRAMVIYEMHIQDFVGSTLNQDRSVFVQAVDKLDYLRDLGINAVELMPVSDFPGEYSWGYNPRYAYAVENNFGTPDEFAYFVDECHARGIRVLLDVVFNHGEPNNPLSHIDYTYWFYKENPDDAAFHWGDKFNYGFYDEKFGTFPARDFAKDVMLHWINFFHLDGLRFDATEFIDNYDTLHYWNDAIYDMVGGIKPFITVAEQVPEDASVTGFDGPLDAAWHESFSKQLMSIMVGESVAYRQPDDLDTMLRAMQPTQEGYTSSKNTINYIDNHDQDRIFWQMTHAGLDEDTALRRIRMGMAILLTCAGIPLLWMGTEFAPSSEKTIEARPLDWGLLADDRRADMRNYFYGLINLRTHNGALQSENIEILEADQSRMFMVYRRWDDTGEVIVAANMGNDYIGFEVDATGGEWHEYTYDYRVEASDNRLSDNVAEHEVKVYIRG